MLEVVGQDIISGNMGFIGTDPGREYQMGAAEKTEDVTVTGNPAVLDNATGKPFKDLHIYGRSEQMTTTGAQLLDLDALELRQETGATVERLDDGGFLINGTPKAAYEQYIRAFTLDLEPGTYYISGGKYSAGCAVAQVNFINADDTRTNYGNGKFDVLGTEKDIFLVVQSTDTNQINNYKVYPMLSKGSAALPFEPYTGGKPSPSPDYPQEIVSAGEDGNLNVMVRGKNIFPGPEQPKTVEKNGLTFSYKDGMYTLVGTSNTDTWFNIYPNIRNSTSAADTGGTIHSIGKVAVANGLKNESCTISIRDANIKDKTENITSSNNKKHLSFDTNGVFIYVRPGTYSETFTLMIVDENQTEDYELYHTPQTLTLSTPNGLPGIPVTSGGNYTDENGQQWICDEVDLGRGVYRQRIEHVNVVFNKVASSATHSGYRHVATDIQNMSREHKECLCNIATYSETASNGTEGIRASGEYNTIVLYYDNLTDDNVSADVAYILSDPIETSLTAAEIAAYKSLRTYRGTTIVEAEDKAGISATFKRNVKTGNVSAEKKIEESEKKEYDES